MAPKLLPEILVLCIHDADIRALNDALRTRWPSHADSLTITTIHEGLRNLPDTNKFDLMVSPANSYGIMDGGFDDAISRTFCLPEHNYRALTDAAQRRLYEQWRGFAPPGTCTLVTMPAELQATNRWGCRYLALCPTMRVPGDARWDREVVYECVWSLMCEIDRFNKSSANATTRSTTPTTNDDGDEEKTLCGKEAEADADAEGDKPIKKILTTPLATGFGRVSSDKWAAQFVLALKHFADALERPERWSRLEWTDLREVYEVQATYDK